jgi:hypothetical protein
MIVPRQPLPGEGTSMTKREIQDQIEAIEARPLAREERDRLQAPLLALLRLERTVDEVRRAGFGERRG